MHTEPLTKFPAAVGAREGFSTEIEAIDAWNTLENKYEYAVRYIVNAHTGNTIAIVFEPCDPKLYTDYYKVGEVV